MGISKSMKNMLKKATVYLLVMSLLLPQMAPAVYAETPDGADAVEEVNVPAEAWEAAADAPEEAVSDEPDGENLPAEAPAAEPEAPAAEPEAAEAEAPAAEPEAPEAEAPAAEPEAPEAEAPAAEPEGYADGGDGTTADTPDAEDIPDEVPAVNPEAEPGAAEADAPAAEPDGVADGGDATTGDPQYEDAPDAAAEEGPGGETPAAEEASDEETPAAEAEEESGEETPAAEAEDESEAETDAAETEAETDRETGQESETETAPMPAGRMKAASAEMEVFAEWDEGIFPEDVTMVVRRADAEAVMAAAQDLVGEDREIVDAIAVDVSFYTYTNGKREEVEPTDPSGVHVTLTARRSVEGEDHEVVHVDDSGAAELVTEAEVEANEAEFDSVGFSVYAIIGTDEKQAEDIARRTYIFWEGEVELSRQTVKNGDTLIEPATPIPADADHYFIGWFIRDTETQIDFTLPIVITDIGTDADETVNVDARFFEEFTVIFYGKEVGGERPILEIETGDTGDTVSTAGIIPQALSGNEELIGWSETENASEAQYGTDETITIGTSDIKLYPVIRAVRKIEFFGNGLGDYVSFTAPIYVIPGEKATKPADPTRTGFTFGGWYTDPLEDNDLDESKRFDWDQAIQAGDEPILLYAGWNSDQTDYEVYIWGEYNGTGQYQLEATFTAEAPAGTVVTQEFINTSVADHPDSFDPNYYIFNETASAAAIGSKIKGDGSTIINIYYDQREFTIEFNPRLRMTINGTEGYGSTNHYSFTAKIGEDITDKWPSEVVITTPGTNYFHGWVLNRQNTPTDATMGDTIIIGPRYTLSKSMIREIEGTPQATSYYVSVYDSNNNNPRKVNIYIANIDGTYPAAATYTYSINPRSASGFVQPVFEGYEVDRMDQNGNNVTLYYKRLTYDILFHNYSVGDPGSTTGVTQGADISQYNHTPDRDETGLPDYYTFQGWYTDRQYINEWTFTGDQAVMPDHTLVLYACWKPKDIIITLNDGFGASKTETVPAGSRIAEPVIEAPSEDLTFEGWYIGSTKVDFENRIFESDTTLTARWISSKMYRVQYEDPVADHPVAVDENEYRLGAHILLLEPTTDIHGAENFHGYTISGMTGTYLPGYILSFDSPSLADEDGIIHITAVHQSETVPKVRIVYDANGGTGGTDGKVESNVQNQNEEYTAIENPFTRTGYTFVGWSTSAGATEAQFQPGASIAADTVSATLKDGVYESTLYAVWEQAIVEYTITHYLQNVEGTGYEIPAGGQYTRTGRAGETASAVAREFTGFAFDAGKTGTEAASAGQTFGGTTVTGTILADGSLELKLYYKRNAGYTVTYQYEGYIPVGANDLLPTDSSTYAFGQTVTVAPTFTDEEIKTLGAFTFSGWYTKRIPIAGGQFTMPDYNIIVYGQFTPVSNGSTYRITHYGEITDGSSPAFTVDGVGYKVLDTYTGKGTAGETATAQPQTRFEGYTYDGSNSSNVTSGTIMGNGSLELKLFYKANENTLTYHYTGTIPANAPAAPADSMHKYGETVTIAAEPTLAGYTFSGWNKLQGSDLVINGDSFSMPNRDVELVGSWTPKTDTKYRVTHYGQKLGGGWDVLETYESLGTTDATYTASPHSFPGYTYQEGYDDGEGNKEVISGVITAAEELELKLYYKRNSGFTVTYEYDGTEPVAAPAVPEDSNTYQYGEEVTLQTITAPAGYDFLGWSINGVTITDGKFNMPDGNVTAVGSFMPREDTPWKVCFFYQLADGSYPTAPYFEKINYGQTGSSVTVTNAPAPAGFTYDVGKSGELPHTAVIAGDGSTVINLYYKRNTWGISYQWEAMESGVTYPVVPVDSNSYMYATRAQWVDPATVTAPDGYVFNGWHTREGSDLLVDPDTGEFTMPDRDVVFFGSFSPEENGADFRVEHWGEKADGSGEYESLDSYTRTGTIGAVPTIEPHTFTGFEFDSTNPNNVTTGPISSAHDTVYKLYYKRIQYDVKYNWTGAAVADGSLLPETVQAGYGTTVTLAPDIPDTSWPAGYTFVSWRLADTATDVTLDTATSPATFVMPNRAVNLYGEFIPNADTAYKVEHYKQKLDGSYELADTDDLTGTTGAQVTAAAKTTYTGFALTDTAETVKSGTIQGDGTLVLKLYYNRNTYSVTYSLTRNDAGDAVTVPESLTGVMYGAEVTAAYITVSDGYSFDGYSFDGWDCLGTRYEGGQTLTMPNQDITLTGSVIANSDTPYTIRYLGEVLGSEPVADWIWIGENPYVLLSEDKMHTGITGTTVTAVAQTFPGFTFDENDVNNKLSDTLAGDGSTLLICCYTRNTYRLKYQYEGYIPQNVNLKPGELPEKEYKYGDQIGARPAVAAVGYTFGDWDMSGLTQEEGLYYMPANDVTVTGRFAPITFGARYTVTHYGTALGTEDPDKIKTINGQDYIVLDSNEYSGTPSYEATYSAGIFTGFTYNETATEGANPEATVSGTSVTKTIENATEFIFLYDRNSGFTVTYQYEGTVPAGAPAVPAQQTNVPYGSEIAVAADQTLAGYDFISWHTLSTPSTGDHIDIVNGTFTMPNRNVTIVGQFTARNDTKFRVSHYLEQLDGSFAIPQKDGANDPEYYYERTGTTGSTYTAAPKTLTGFTYDEGHEGAVKSGTITAPDELELKLYYTRNSYSVTYEYTGTVPQGAPSPEGYGSTNKYGQADIAFKDAPTLAGYTFDGWTSENSSITWTQGGTFTMPAANVKFTGSWTANSDTEYKVERYVENLNGTGFDKYGETETRTGTTGETVAIEEEAISGFTFDRANENNVLSGPIAGDGSFTLKAYYTRNSYTVHYSYTSAPAAATALPADAAYKFGANVTIADDAAAPGYDFNGWKASAPEGQDPAFSDGDTAFDMPARDVFITGSFTPRTDTPYEVRIFYQKDDGTFPEDAVPDQSFSRTGTTDTTASVTDEDKTPLQGYVLYEDRSTLSGRITGDGRLVLRIYFKQDKNNDGKPDDEQTFTVVYRNGDHGAFTEGAADKTEFEGLSVRDVTPAYAGEKDAAKDDTPQGQVNYVFDKWQPEVNETVDAADADKDCVITYTALWKDDRNNDGIADEDQTFTVVYRKGDRGTFTEDEPDKTRFEGLSVGTATPAFAGEADVNKDGTPQGQADYVFDRWQPEVKETVDAADAAAGTVVITYTATWKDDRNNNGIPDAEEVFTVIFRDGDGTELRKVENLGLGDTVDAYTPAKTDYVFDKWDPAFKTTVAAEDFDENSTRTYTASWKDDRNNDGRPDEDQVFRVVYDLAGGSTTSAATEFSGLKVGETTPKITDPTKKDYAFTGWNPAVAATVKAEDAKNSADRLTITYTATWKDDRNSDGTPDEEEYYKITFDPNGGSWNGSKKSVVIRYHYGEIITIYDAPTRDGYTFDYWFGSEYQPGDRYEVTGSHTFKAQWVSIDQEGDEKSGPDDSDKETGPGNSDKEPGPGNSDKEPGPGDTDDEDAPDDTDDEDGENQGGNRRSDPSVPGNWGPGNGPGNGPGYGPGQGPGSGGQDGYNPSISGNAGSGNNSGTGEAQSSNAGNLAANAGTGNTVGKAVNTGDSTPVAFWLMLMCLGAAGIAAAAYIRKRRYVK